jgi:hypothetical protein
MIYRPTCHSFVVISFLITFSVVSAFVHNNTTNMLNNRLRKMLPILQHKLLFYRKYSSSRLKFMFVTSFQVYLLQGSVEKGELGGLGLDFCECRIWVCTRPLHWILLVVILVYSVNVRCMDKNKNI